MVYTGYLLSERGFSGDILQCVASNNCIFTVSLQLLTMCSIIKLNFQTGYTNKAKVFEANNPFGYQLLVHPQIHKRNFHAIDQKKCLATREKRFKKKYLNLQPQTHLRNLTKQHVVHFKPNLQLLRSCHFE